VTSLVLYVPPSTLPHPHPTLRQARGWLTPIHPILLCARLAARDTSERPLDSPPTITDNHISSPPHTPALPLPRYHHSSAHPARHSPRPTRLTPKHLRLATPSASQPATDIRLSALAIAARLRQHEMSPPRMRPSCKPQATTSGRNNTTITSSST
jgi:hypothetical protein